MTEDWGPDRFTQLPELVRERIFRNNELYMQRRIARAYENTNEEYVLDRFRVFKQPIHCWVCMLSVYVTKFWHVAVGYSHGQVRPSNLRRAPAHESDGFKILYTLKEKNEYEGIEAYRLRNFATDDALESDEIFQSFLDEIDAVMTFQTRTELNIHIADAHKTLANFDERIFDVFQEFRGTV